jgi:FkbM family methyltransferase
MINFSGMKGAGARVLRAMIHAIPDGTTLRVLQGPLRGAKWISGASTAGCWLGSYEVEMQDRIGELLDEGAVFLDVGANVGFFTLLASRAVGDGGRVIAFEPHPRNLDLLRRHVEMNECRNVEVVAAAVSDREGTARFGGFGSTAKLTDDGAFEVRTMAVDDLWASGAFGAPRLVKIDVEGAELSALLGMRRMIEETRPHILLELHGQWIDGKDVDTECRNLLREIGYDLEPFDRGLYARFGGVPEAARPVAV